MKLLDRFLRRTAAPVVVRSFDGAAGGRRGSGMRHFGRINSEVAAAGQTLASRAGYLVANNPLVANAVENWIGEAVESGPVANARIADPDQRKAFNAYFNDWFDEADATSRTDFGGVCAQLVRDMIVKGEGLAIWQGSKLRALDPALIDSTNSDGDMTFAGVEFNAEGARIAYWLHSEKPGDMTTTTPSVRVDAADVIHLFQSISADQVRGASWLAPIILPASDFDRYCDALLKSAEVAAMSAGFIVNQNAVGESSGEEPTWEPGGLTRLGLGEDVKFNSPQQLQQADVLLKSSIRALAAGLGLPSFMVDGDLSQANYSSLRAGLMPFRRRVTRLQYNTLVPQLLAPVYRRVILGGILSGALEAAEFNESDLKADWLFPRPLQVDPLKDVEATVAEIDAGLTSRRKAIAERGWVMEDLDAEIAADTFQPKAVKNDDSNA